MDRNSLIELYKQYVEMADRVSDRRMKSNQFYMTLLSSLLVVLSFVFHKDSQPVIGTYNSMIIFFTGLLGIIVCLIWWVNIGSYRQLNSQKFVVIHELEQVLPFSPYAREWELLGNGAKSAKYLQLTRIERYVPLILMAPYLVMFFAGLGSFLAIWQIL